MGDVKGTKFPLLVSGNRVTWRYQVSGKEKPAKQPKVINNKQGE